MRCNALWGFIWKFVFNWFSFHHRIKLVMCSLLHSHSHSLRMHLFYFFELIDLSSISSSFVPKKREKFQRRALHRSVYNRRGEYLGVTVTRAMISKLKLNHHKSTCSLNGPLDIEMQKTFASEDYVLKCEDLLIVVELCDTSDAKTLSKICRHRNRD